MATWDSLVQYFTVQYTVIGTINDGPDADDTPDLTTINGTITFEPNLSKGRGIKVLGSNPPVELIPLRRKVKVENGKLMLNGVDHVKLEAAGAYGAPSDWNWRVSFDLFTPDSKLMLDSFSIPAIPNSVVDLTTVSPVSESTGTPIVRGPKGFSIVAITLISGDTLRFTSDDPDHPVTAELKIPAIADVNANAAVAVAARAAAELAAGNAHTSEVSAAASAASAHTDAQRAEDAASQAASGAPGGGWLRNQLEQGVRDSLDKADTAYQKPGAGIPKTDTATAVQTSLGKADTAYQKPGAGIPKTDTATAVQTSLDKADTAYQKPGAGIPATDLTTAAQATLTSVAAKAAKTDIAMDISFGHTAASTVRTVGFGPNASGVRFGHPGVYNTMIVELDTVDGGGSTTVRALLNGTAITGASVTVAAGLLMLQSTGTWAVNAGDKMTFECTAVGTTTGKGLTVRMYGNQVIA